MKTSILVGITLCLLLLALPAAASDYTLGIFGNANEDDTINMQDVTYTELIILEYRDRTELADGKYDGKINMQDVTQIELVILGRELELTVLDLADRAVTINKPVERVVLTFGCYPEFVAIEGGNNPFEKIVGWDNSWYKWRRWIYEKYRSEFPEIEDITYVGSVGKDFSVEKVISLKPDLVTMYPGSIKNAETAVEQLDQAGIPTICVDYHTETIETHARSTLMLGYMLGKEERAQEIVDFYIEHVTEVYSRVDNVDKPKPKVYVECGMEGPSEYSNTYGDLMWGALIETCGGTNIAKDVVEGWGPINPEYLLDANPDVIIITGSYWADNPGSMKLGYYADYEESRELLKAFTERPGWDTLDAVKNNRVYSIHHGISRHIYDFAPIQYMAKCFYPEEFEDLDPEENFKEFHERFLPVDCSGVWMMSLEEETE
ncbi:MAG: ABC transporter substrate-binding protein [Euryarchaeota archaeon]|nr:ABC transporter substrate-binding protein [Euryarchaeota archaeon]